MVSEMATRVECSDYKNVSSTWLRRRSYARQEFRRTCAAQVKGEAVLHEKSCDICGQASIISLPLDLSNGTPVA